MYIGCVADLLERVAMSEIEVVDINGKRLHYYVGNKEVETEVSECEVIDFEINANKITIYTWGDVPRPIL